VKIEKRKDYEKCSSTRQRGVDRHIDRDRERGEYR
jgi:hypothetical protein